MSEATRRFGTLVIGAVLLACLLGICLDLITANVAVEYFSIHHDKIVDSENPWVLAIVWGIAASWWFGLIMGAMLAGINHFRQTPLSAWRILKWGAIGAAVLWGLMIAVLVGVYSFAGTIPEEQRPESFESDRRLVAVAMAHQFEYLLGGVLLLILGWRVWVAEPRARSHMVSDKE